jgi:hypothetical protein
MMTLTPRAKSQLRNANSPWLAACFVILHSSFLIPASAQWQNTSHELKGGWNSIYLHGDASHDTPDGLFASGDAANIEEIWRWNPNPTQVQFTTDPLIPTPGTPEWSTWYRGNPGASSLSAMTGQTAYLVKCSGTQGDSYSVQIKCRPQPPSSVWVRNGANLLGFPTKENGSSFPTMSSYFATFPAAIAANTKVFKYVGGDLGPGNPLQVFSPTFEQVDRNAAYWFEAKVVGNFYAPIEVEPTISAGLEFGRTRSIIAVRVRNRTNATVTVTFSPEVSDAAPVGQAVIVGAVPLTRRAFDTGSNQYVETPISGAFDEVVGPQSSVELEFGIDRGAMSGASGDVFASLLRVQDSGGLMEVDLPVSAQIGSLAGLWVGDATVEEVDSTVPGSSGATTPNSLQLRYLVHVDSAGTARLLSHVFIGVLGASGTEVGLTVLEDELRADQLASATRLAAAHMPLDRVLTTGSGSVALGGTLTRTITIPFDDPVSPFVHAYHPDHDNRDPRGQLISAGEESYDISRQVSFEFLATPPAGVSGNGWGSSVLGGNYSETITGAHKEALTTRGSFVLRRVSEISEITLAP